MKKIILPLVTLVLIIGTLFFILSLNQTKEITSNAEIEAIKQDANLDIIVNLGNFSIDSYSERKLLDVAMQYAMKLNLLHDESNDFFYFQYADEKTIHDLIFELTGKTIEKPIEIEDFYYLYNKENSFYYYLGASPSYYKVSNIKSIQKTNNKYLINCSIQKTEDGEISILEDVSITLNYISENKVIKYQVENIIINKK